MVDDNEFFRSATLSICGSLEIEEAMCACARTVQEFLPVDRMYLQVYEPDLGAMRTLATATAEGGEKVDMLTPLAGQTRELIRQRAAAAEEDVVVIDSEERNPVAREMLRFHGLQGSSILRMRLATGGGRGGARCRAGQRRGGCFGDLLVGERSVYRGLRRVMVAAASLVCSVDRTR